MTRLGTMIGVLAVCACSFVGVKGPQSHTPPGTAPQCTRSRELPDVDSAVGIIGFLVAPIAGVAWVFSDPNPVVFGAEASTPHRDPAFAVVAVTALVGGIVYGASARYGDYEVARCIEARDRWGEATLAAGRNAAAAGDCSSVATLDVQLCDEEREFHDTSFAVDPAILRCADEAGAVARCAQRAYDRCIAARAEIDRQIKATPYSEKRRQLIKSAPTCSAPAGAATDSAPP